MTAVLRLSPGPSRRLHGTRRYKFIRKHGAAKEEDGANIDTHGENNVDTRSIT
ncbi:hypothetical protein DPMN_045338 [Dreissena polymorpha]|uniref:Uncharacterized protein n=1 Tax=Dreissena polymorpha TaxID=45954 RepID=A0A9D4HZM9_DREPO|nr:hypothetical protein DPMN_045338 [Dreissena polymorpha]